MEKVSTVFEQIYQLTYDKVAFYVLSKCGTISEVEDILQDVYTELYKVLSDKGVVYLSSPEGFVMHLAKSKVFQYYSKKERKQAGIYVDSLIISDAEKSNETAPEVEIENWEDVLIDKLTADEVMAYLARKDELTKEIFYQHYFQDKTLKEIAESCGMKESTIKKRLYRTLQELRGMKRFVIIIVIFILAALLAKPVYSWAEDVISQIKRYLVDDTQNTLEIISLGATYRDYKNRIEKGELPSDIRININGEDYTMELLEEVWKNNPWLESLDWGSEIDATADGIVSYVTIYEDGDDKGKMVESEKLETIVQPTKTPDKQER